MGIWLGTNFIFGLYVYCRLFQLSLDRTSEKARDEMEGFFVDEHLPLPGVVTSAIEKFLADGDTSPAAPANFLLYLRGRLGLAVARTWLCESELERIRNVLTVAEQVFSLSDAEIVQRRNEIRLALAGLEQRLGELLPSRLQKKGLKVRHLNHAKHLKLDSFVAIVDSSWPKPNLSTHE